VLASTGIIWSDLLKNYTTFEATRGEQRLVLQALLSGPAQGQQRDLGRHANPHREAEGSEAAVHIQRRLLHASRLQTVAGRNGRIPVHRQVIKSGDKRCDQARRTDAVIHNLKLNLPALSMPRKAKLDAKLGGPM